jgi:hypothetical protein
MAAVCHTHGKDHVMDDSKLCGTVYIKIIEASGSFKLCRALRNRG